jgi:hypothetical protein
LEGHESVVSPHEIGIDDVLQRWRLLFSDLRPARFDRMVAELRAERPVRAMVRGNVQKASWLDLG